MPFIVQITNIVRVTIAKMTYGSWIQKTTSLFKKAGIESAHLDSILLLQYVSGHDKAYLLAHSDTILQLVQGQTLQELVQRRTAGEPMAYILGKKEFYGRDFIIDKNVLVPRPESEDFISLIKSILSNKNHFLEVGPLKTLKIKLLDVGTGSGCLAITAKLELPYLNVTGTDISSAALTIAKKNAYNLNAKIIFKKMNLLYTKPKNTVDIIFANLPYVPNNYSVAKNISFEPKQAIFADKDGLELIYKLAPQAYEVLKADGIVLIECLLEQQDNIKNYYCKNGFRFIEKRGLVQMFAKTLS